MSDSSDRDDIPFPPKQSDAAEIVELGDGYALSLDPYTLSVQLDLEGKVLPFRLPVDEEE